MFQTTDPYASIPRFSRVGKKLPTRRGGEPVLSPPRASEHLSGELTEARKSCPCDEREAASNGRRPSGRTKRTRIPHAKERQKRRSPQRRARTRRHTQKGRASERERRHEFGNSWESKEPFPGRRALCRAPRRGAARSRGGGSAAEGARRGGRAPRIPPAAAMPLPKAEPAKPVNWQQFAYLWCLLPFSVIALQAGKVTEKYITPSKKTAKRLIRAQGL